MPPRAWLFAVASLAAPGCFLDRTPFEPPSAQPDGSADAGRADGGGRDAGLPRDAGRDAGEDGGRDATIEVPPDAGSDAGPPGVPVEGGLLAHFDALDVAGDGSEPTSEEPAEWVDLTGGNDAACTGVDYQPNGLGPGRPAMFTDGNVGSRCQFPIPDLTDVTILVVLRTSDTRSASHWYEVPVIVGGDRDGAHQDAAFYLSGGRPGFGRRIDGLQFQSTVSVADDRPHVVSLVRSGADGAVAIGVDSRLVQRGRADSGGIQDPNHWWLASHTDASAGRFASRYAEVLVYRRALSDAEVAAVRRYLRLRWGL